MTVESTLSELTQNVDLALSKLQNQSTRTSVSLSRIVGDIYPGDTVEFKITNYDTERNYVVAAALGTANLAVTGNTPETLEAIVDYTAPNAPGNESLQINDRIIQFPILERVVVKPTLVSPANGGADVALAPTLTSSAFASTPAGYDTHQSTDWEIATDAGFTVVVWQSADNGTDLETITLPTDTLDGGTLYYARVRHTGATLGDSQWSDTISFTTIQTGLVGNPVIKLRDLSGALDDYFGYSVAVTSDGTQAAIGAIYEDSAGSQKGAVYHYKLVSGSWTLQHKITEVDVNGGDQFGFSVAISGDGNTIVVGAPYNDQLGTNAGKAIVYTYNGTSWSRHSTLLPTEYPQANDNFGHSVSISEAGDRILVGAIGDDTANTNAGVVYFFHLETGSWNLISRVYGQNTVAADQFGYSVAISGDGQRAIIGAPMADSGPTSNAGSAYIFTWSGANWIQEALLPPPAGEVQSDAHYGNAVAINQTGDRVVIGARYQDVPTSNEGAAYVFTKASGSWAHERKLFGTVRAQTDQFGYSVAISGDGDTIIVGANNESTYQAGSGAAYIFVFDGTWTERAKVKDSPANSGDNYGHSVALSHDGGTALVGAIFDDNSGTVTVLN